MKECTQSIKTNRCTDQQISLWSVSLLFYPHAHLSLSPPVVEHMVEHCTWKTFDLARHRLHYWAKVWPINLLQFYMSKPFDMLRVQLQLSETQSVESCRQDGGSLRVFNLSQNPSPGLIGFVIPASETKEWN